MNPISLNCVAESRKGKRQENGSTNKASPALHSIIHHSNNHIGADQTVKPGQSHEVAKSATAKDRMSGRHVHFPRPYEEKGSESSSNFNHLQIDTLQSKPSTHRNAKVIRTGRFAGLVATPIVEDRQFQANELTPTDSYSDSARSHSDCSNDTWDGKDAHLLHSRTNSAETSLSDCASWSGYSVGNSSGCLSHSKSRPVKMRVTREHSDVIRKTLAKDFRDVVLKSRSEELKYKQKVCQYLAAEGKVRDYLLSTEQHQPYHPTSDNESLLCGETDSTSSDTGILTLRSRRTIHDLRSNHLLSIFSHLPTRDLCNAAAVCRKWYKLCWTPELWSTIDIGGYNGDANIVIENILKRLSKISPYACLVIRNWKINSCQSLSDESLKLISRRCPEIQHLELAKCPLITGAGIGDIFANCPNLTLLNIASCPGIGSIDSSLQNGVSYGEKASFLQLHYIDLSECLVDDAGLDMIARSCSYLEYLYLRRCEAITDKGLIAVANYCTGVRELSVSNCSLVTDSGCRFLVKKCHDLRYISLAKCAISDETVKQIAKHCRKVRYLNLHMCHSISDEGVARIAQSCDKLRAFDIGKCEKITDTSLNFISVNSPQLRRLNIKGCDRISDSGLRKLATHCRGLKHLNVQECDFTLETYLYLRQRCVSCVIEHTKPEFC